MIKDPYGRPVTGIRISVTQRCNLNCIYCHREGETRVTSWFSEMSPDEIERIVRIAVSLGISKVKITGGEPLIRKDILEIVERVASVRGVKDLSMTTNGVFLEKYADRLSDAGLMRVNVSLDTLDPAKYKMITGHDSLERVKRGIRKARDAGLYPIKVNMVLLRGINEDEVWRMIEFCREVGAILQLIELVPLGTPNFDKYHVDLERFEQDLAMMSEKIVPRKLHHRMKYFLHGGGEVEVVRPFHNSVFCANCTRIRVTSDGKLKPCLMRNDNLVDILTPMRRGASDEELKRLFLKAISLREPFYKG